MTIALLIFFAVLCFIQNMAFTWSSRSRNSGDPNYHRKASWASNGVYYLTNALLTIYIVQHIHGIIALLISGLIYTVTTAEGSVLMMKYLLKKEKGKRSVGASEGLAQIPQAVWDEFRQFMNSYVITVDVPGKEGTFTPQELLSLKRLVRVVNNDQSQYRIVTGKWPVVRGYSEGIQLTYLPTDPVSGGCVALGSSGSFPAEGTTNG